MKNRTRETWIGGQSVEKGLFDQRYVREVRYLTRYRRPINISRLFRRSVEKAAVHLVYGEPGPIYHLGKLGAAPLLESRPLHDRPANFHEPVTNLCDELIRASAV